MNPERECRIADPGRKTLLILCSPRTGSTLLSRSITETGLFGHPGEFLNPGQYPGCKDAEGSYLIQHLRKAYKRSRTENGYWAIKMHYYQFRSLMDRLVGDYPEFNNRAKHLIKCLFGNAKIIFLTRDDYIAQAVSGSKAQQSRKYMSQNWDVDMLDSDEDTYSFDYRYDYYQIRRAVEMQQSDRRQWEELFVRENMHPFRVTYRELSDSYLKTMQRIFRYLEFSDDQIRELSNMTPPTKKLADIHSQKWIQRFRAEQLKVRLKSFLRVFLSIRDKRSAK